MPDSPLLKSMREKLTIFVVVLLLGGGLSWWRGDRGVLVATHALAPAVCIVVGVVVVGWWLEREEPGPGEPEPGSR